MASSDEEGEIIPDCITNYHLVDYTEEPISFSRLPLQWSEDEISDDLSIQLFLRGTADDGLQQIYKKVIAWKFELSYVLPEIYLLSKDKTWIKLLKPRKSFESTIKTILITIHCLHFMKTNQEASRNAVWNHLLKAFSSYEIEPSENDLLDHLPLINEAAIRDKEIAKSEFLQETLYFAALLVEPGKRKAFHEDIQTTKKSKFIVDSDDDDDDGDEDDDAHEFDERVLFDSVCALCDNGGELLCCEGRCTRSFHATVDAGADSLCESLGYTDAQVEHFRISSARIVNTSGISALFVASWALLINLLVQRSSPVFLQLVAIFIIQSVWQNCFTHVMKLRQKQFRKKLLQENHSYVLPTNVLYVSKEKIKRFMTCNLHCVGAVQRHTTENAYPVKIAFEGDGDKNIHQRAWDGLLPNRILIYCMDHKIIPLLGTPERNHILFPGVDEKKKRHRIESLSGKEKVMAEKRSTVSVSVTERTAAKMPKKLEYATVTGGESPKELEKGFFRQGSMSKVTDVTMKSLRTNTVSVQARMCKLSTTDKNKSSFGIDHSLPIMRSNTVMPKQQNFLSGKTKSTIAAMPVMKKVCITQPLGDEEEKRIVALMKRSTASFNLEEFIKNQGMLSNNADACSSRFVVDKTMTKGRVEAYVRAIRAALKKLEEGCTTGDAKEVCGPEILKQIVRWKGSGEENTYLHNYSTRGRVAEKQKQKSKRREGKGRGKERRGKGRPASFSWLSAGKLKVYLAPFLHGMRYTSFGRHFTKLDKLKEIVDRLHWYVQDGDMIVDFCCGSNDFSCLLSKKLEQMGKSCSFRNYDLIQSKQSSGHNDFNFEKRDWMSVCVEELPAGSQLIMGLNPPFGVHASRANQFIEKALKFKPKLLILIVPRETKRLDEKIPPYDLIWEDGELLSGKSFYLPGSVDVHEQQMEQWNWKAPPLYLWSRSDWTAQHKAIARNHGHLSKEQAENDQKAVSNYLMEENQDCYGDFSDIMDGCGDISRILDDVPEDSDDNEGARANVPNMQQESPSPLVDGCGGPPLEIDEMYMDMELSTPPNFPCNDTRLKSLSECQPEPGLETPAEANAGQQDFEYLLQPYLHGHGLQFGTEYTMLHTAVPNAVGSSYNWSTSTSYGVGGRSLNVGDKHSDYVEYAVENIGQSQH
ncbi:unnamed protein product [Camellia sinensis]